MEHDPTARPSLNRRTLLGLGAAVGLTALLAACAPKETAQAGNSPKPVFDRAGLPTGLKGSALLPGDPGYADEIKTYNLLMAPQPGVIIAAADASDVQAGVRLAAERGAPVAVLATGHQLSAPIGPDTVLITTRAMRGVTVDAQRRVARAEAGVRWGQVVDESVKVGLAPLNGSTPIVGVVGYTLGGGLSPTMGRAYGYAADHVRSVDVVTADGRLRTVTAETDPDLFFAVRGGKSNFGVVTAIEFDLFPVKTLYGGAIMFDGADAGKVLHAYREWVKTVPDEMSSSVALMRMPDVAAVPEPLRGKFVTSVRISYIGSPKSGAKLLGPLRGAAKPIIDAVHEMPYSDFATIHADPVDAAPIYERTGLLKELTAETVDELLAAAGPTASFPITMTEIRHLGGALGRQPAQPNAVSNRDAAFTLFVASVGTPADAAAIKKAEADIIRRMQPWSTGGMYLNFMAGEDVAPEAVQRAYQPDVYQRLVAVKRKVDPTNMFRLNHNIKPA
ncbi:FAD-linked oxidase [Planotetraspora thailandica]|uniref:FAD-linked oxidase n=1 Tax=Planotetraspora thailandica TaxID=487172 RepID=A0A8J3V0D8_9ACTN|nr:FAD-dependent oxidoreductase [Planotetraspora thailandica]GII52741.1 FAD-linked oxidase [Planotetraspora thailandica]